MVDNNIYRWLKLAGNTYSGKPSLGDIANINLALSLIDEELEETKEAIKNNNLVEFLDGIGDLKWVINNLTFFAGIDKELMENVLTEIEVSNYSKYTTSQTIAQRTIEAYYHGTHPSKPGIKIDADYKKTRGLYIIFRKSDFKILKSIDYEPADIKTVVEEYLKRKNI